MAACTAESTSPAVAKVMLSTVEPSDGSMTSAGVPSGLW